MGLPNLTKLREMKGVTMQEVGDAIGRSKSWVQRVEKGTRNIKMTDLTVLADYFGCSVAYLIGRDK